MPIDSSHNFLHTAQFDTALGPMVAVGDKDALYLLEFVQQERMERQIKALCTQTKLAVVPGVTEVIKSIEAELKEYFSGKLKVFKTPLHTTGSPFQKSSWDALMKIPYGHTVSYAGQADSIGKPTACRAVANANGANKIAIVIPCHRVINSNGMFGGYGGGLYRKKWLIDLEKQNSY